MRPTTALIFAKYPRPRRVNARMTPPLTPEEAAELHAHALRAVLQRARRGGLYDRVVLAGTPDNDVPAFAALAGATTPIPPGDIWPQGDGDLGQCLIRGIRRALEEGAGIVTLLGADSRPCRRTSSGPRWPASTMPTRR